MYTTFRPLAVGVRIERSIPWEVGVCIACWQALVGVCVYPGGGGTHNIFAWGCAARS